MHFTPRSSFALLALMAVSLALQAQDSVPVDVGAYDGVIKLACVGDSITEGVGADDGKSWPTQIQAMLGEKWLVGNFGVSATTLLNVGNKPYQKDPAFTKALEFAPNVVVIMLGTNDTKAKNWAHKDQFTADYQDLISKFAALPTKPRIFICYPPYIAGKNGHGITEENTLAEIPMIDAAAAATKSTIIDIHGALAGKDALIPDLVHPNNAGMTLIATTVYKSLTGKAPAVK